MPIRETIFEVGGYYHVYNRGNNREAIFFEHDNYLFFLKQVRKYLLPHLDFVAYCLMPTHYHFLVRVRPVPRPSPEVPESPDTFQDATPQISKAMQRFTISYTKAINKRFERVGSLFQGPFQAKRI